MNKKLNERVSSEELRNLLDQYERDNKNLDLINKIAIGYSQNLEMCRNNEDIDFFEKAYRLKKTVKSTHNFASHLSYEYGDYKKAEKVQSECLKLNPQRVYPYLLYAEILIENQKYEQAVTVLEKSKRKKETYNAEHNLGYCKYMLKDYTGAQKHFLNVLGEDDNELKSLFGLILIYYRLGDKDIVYEYIEKMKQSNFMIMLGIHMI